MQPIADPAERPCVLIVEDDDDSREILGVLVSSFGYRQMSASNAREAMEQVEQSRPDLALIDLGLPGIDGFDVARHLRAAVGRIHLIALTGYCDGASRQSANAAGFDDFLVKPILPEALETLLRQAVA